MNLKQALFATLISIVVVLVCIGLICLLAWLFHKPHHEIAPYFILGMIASHLITHAFKD